MAKPPYRFFAALLLCVWAALAYAHPEDEFCEAGEMDPLLCAQLSQLDRPAADNRSPLPEIRLERSPLNTGLLYTKLGIEHILPLGLDHLAFVFALLLSCRAFRPLLLQISLFTLAHSLTLMLGVFGIVALQGKWTEVAIAFSIVFVAVENIFLSRTNYWRGLLIFGFGLLHGLGFAGALSNLGIPDDHFISALLGFNLGVEIAQLGFAAAVFVLLSRFVNRGSYRRLVVIPGSVAVALLGSYWLLERLL